MDPPCTNTPNFSAIEQSAVEVLRFKYIQWELSGWGGRNEVCSFVVGTLVSLFHKLVA